MNGTRAEGFALAREIVGELRGGHDRTATLVICPPFTLLHAVAAALAGSAIKLGAQDCHDKLSGAFTGSIAAPMLADAGCTFVIVGHSERRYGLGETDALVRAKVSAAWQAKLTPILCLGEQASERDAGSALDFVGAQLAASLPPGSGPMVVAYEPVWAIGTGRVPASGDIAVLHGFLRKELTRVRADGAAIPILYGGSVGPENAVEILRTDEVGGVLVGGASLDAASFAAIARAAG